MTAEQSSWRRNPLVLGPLLGWLVGMFWWIGLTVAFAIYDGPNGFRHLGMIVYAPLVAIPWAVVGLVSGGIAVWIPGLWVPVATGVGVIAGGAYTVLTSPFDGWLAMTMPVDCLGWALAGVPIGALAGVGWQGMKRLGSGKAS
jgi:hypothetical protein